MPMQEYRMKHILFQRKVKKVPSVQVYRQYAVKKRYKNGTFTPCLFSFLISGMKRSVSPSHQNHSSHVHSSKSTHTRTERETETSTLSQGKGRANRNYQASLVHGMHWSGEYQNGFRVTKLHFVTNWHHPQSSFHRRVGLSFHFQFGSQSHQVMHKTAITTTRGNVFELSDIFFCI